ncbi:BON domain-containing protein [Paraburkholderia strydomiana]
MSRATLVTITVLSCLLFSPTAFPQGPAPSNAQATASKTADRALAKSVRRALGRVKGLDPTRVYVRVRGDSVTLSGTVHDQKQVELAENAAKSVDGVSAVNNRITIFNEGGK